jgi:hypothetical protein
VHADSDLAAMGKVKPDSAQLGLPSSSCVTGTETRMHATNAAHGLPWFRTAPLTRLTEKQRKPPPQIYCAFCVKLIYLLR